MTICRHELRRNQLSLIIWSGILVGMTALTMLLFPTFKAQMGTLSSVMAMLGPFSSALGLDRLDMTSAMGFYGIENGTMLSVCGSMFAAYIGIGLLSREEGEHTAEFLLTQPVGRANVVLEKLLAMVLLIIAFNAISALSGLLCFLVIGEPIDANAFLLFHLAQLLLHIEIGCICLALSAFARRSQVGMGLGIALCLYFLSLVINLSESVQVLRYITPFSYADASKIMTQHTLDIPLVIIGGGVCLACISIALWRYTRKDIAA